MGVSVPFWILYVPVIMRFHVFCIVCVISSLIYRCACAGSFFQIMCICVAGVVLCCIG